MALNLPTFYKRTATAIVFVAVMLVGLLGNNVFFFSLILLINGLCLFEFIPLMGKMHPDTYWPVWLPAATFVFSTAIIFFCSTFCPPLIRDTFWPLLAVAPAIMLLLAALPEKSSLEAALKAMGGLAYISLPMLLLLYMRGVHMYLPLVLLVMIWCNDTLAYLAGSFFGKTPFSQISPNKTWEGTGGGALLTIIGAVIFGYFSHMFRLADCVALSVCATVAGTLGDLLESKLKRMAGVKDSGSIMPGHGGALDRFDSLLIATPFAAAYVLICMH